jgi:phospholipid/cholesterol/gamma-HCH transport system substrate-binding protein
MSRRLIAACAAVLALTGCSLSKGLYNVTLPGGADVGSHPYTVTAQFGDALDLVPQSGVRVNGVAVGRVGNISLAPSGKYAKVSLLVNGNVDLPANAVASIEQTTLLGEKYVALSAPLDAQPSGRLADHAIIPLDRTSNGVQVEQIFGALALLLNGGGIAQLHDISEQLNQFAHGHETSIRTFLTSVTSVVTQMNEHRDSITTVLDSLDTLSATLKANDPKISTVLADLSPGIAELAREKDQLVHMLTALHKLSTVTVQTLDASKNDIIADLQQLAPILRNLANTGSSLPKSLQILLTFPFTDQAVGGIKGDYLNGYITTAFNTPGGRTTPLTVPANGANSALAPPPSLLPTTSSAAPGLAPSITLQATGGAR